MRFLILAVLLLSGCSGFALDRANPLKKTGEFQGTMPGTTALDNTYQAWTHASAQETGTVTGLAAGALIGTLIPKVGISAGLVIGGLTGNIFGHYIKTHRTLIDKITHANVQIIVLGDHVMIVLPSNLFFLQNTPQLSPFAYSTLNNVAKFIRHFTKITVKVDGYVQGKQSYSKRLAEAQAQAVAHYLWHSDIDTRLIYAQGHNTSYLIHANLIQRWYRNNNRIEITLQKLPV